MYREARIGVVVPCYNEESQVVPRVIKTMPDYVDMIVVVDDCSQDNTVAEVLRYKKEHDPHGRIVLLRHEKNQGVGGAISTGYQWCRDNTIDIAVVMAGDGQMNPDNLPDLLDPLVDGKVDYCKGNRLFTPNALRKVPPIRFFGNAALSLLTKFASGYWNVADSQTGYTAINAKALREIEWDHMYKRYGQPNDLLVRLNIHHLRVGDVPVEPVYNIGEQSGIRVRKVVFTIGWLLIKLVLWRIKEKYILRNFHPLVLFLLNGVATGIFALLFLGVVLVKYFFIDGTMPSNSLVVLMFTFTLSYLSFSFAMWFDYEENRELCVVLD